MLKRHWFNLARHDEKDDAAAAAAAAAKAEADAATAKAKADADAAAAKAKADEPKPMTQADIDAIVKDRLARETKKYADYDDAKAKAKELDELKAAGASEQEKAVTAARDEATTAATLKFGEKLAGAEIKAALTGIVPDPASIVEDLNLTKYVTKDGEVDEAAVAALKAKYEALKPTDDGKGRPKGDKGQGAGGAGGETDFRKATKEEVDAELRKHGIRPNR